MENRVDQEKVMKNDEYVLDKQQQEMHVQMCDFVRSVIDGKTEELKNTTELIQGLWDVLISKNAWISRNYMMCALLGRDSCDAPEEEREAVQEKISGLMRHQQMLVVAYWACRDVELADYKGCYAENNAEILKKLYSCLALYGFFLEWKNMSYSWRAAIRCMLLRKSQRKKSRRMMWRTLTYRRGRTSGIG